MRSDLGYAHSCGVAEAGVAASGIRGLIGIDRAAAAGYTDSGVVGESQDTGSGIGWLLGIASAIARHASASGIEKNAATSSWVGWKVLGAEGL
jgi:hypothetical protein